MTIKVKTMREKAPKEAATIILVRPRAGQIQAYLLKRSTKAKFMPGNYVFPGGMLDGCDGDIDKWRELIDLSFEEIHQRFGGGLSTEKALSFCVAAIRETFEEAGVLLAETQMKNPTDQENLRGNQNNFQPGWFGDVAKTHGWCLSLERLFRWAHWITPSAMKYHYDTRFFVAAMPSGQTCRPDQKETSAGIWIDPQGALEANMAGRLVLSPPTLVTLHMLLPFDGYADFMEALISRPWGPAIQPRFFVLPQGAVIIQPWDPQFDMAKPEIEPETLKNRVLPVGADFSRLWMQNGVWRPVSL